MPTEYSRTVGSGFYGRGPAAAGIMDAWRWRGAGGTAAPVGGTGSLRARKMGRTRAAIEDAALRLFLEQGYAGDHHRRHRRGGGVSPHATSCAISPPKRRSSLAREREMWYLPGGRCSPPDPRRSPCSPARAALVQLEAAYGATRERRLSWAHLVRGTPALTGANARLLAGFEDVVAVFAGGRRGGGPGQRRTRRGRIRPSGARRPGGKVKRRVQERQGLAPASRRR